MMTSTTALHLYRRWLEEVWGKGDFAVSAEVLADDLLDHDAPPQLPPGRAGHDLFCGMIRAAFPDARFELDVAGADGDLAFGRWTMTGTHSGPLVAFGLAPTGRSVRMHGQEIFRVKDGKLAEMWHQEGVVALLMQLGALPGGGPPAGT